MKGTTWKLVTITVGVVLPCVLWSLTDICQATRSNQANKFCESVRSRRRKTDLVFVTLWENGRVARQ